MNAATKETLDKAFNLIEQDRHEEARDMLRPLLSEDKNNPDVWWLYAHAVSDPVEARDALNAVLLLEPNYPGATELLESLRQPVAQPGGPESLPDESENDLDEDFEDWDDDFGEPTEKKTRRRTPLLLLGLLVIVIVVVIAIVLLLSGQKSGAPVVPTGTPVAVQNTPLPRPTIPPATNTSPAETMAPAETVSAETAGTGDFSAVYEALAGFDVPDNGVTTMSSEFGDTLVATICSPEGPQQSQTLDAALHIIAGIASSFSNQVNAIGVRILDCAQNGEPRYIAVSMSDAIAFANGSLDERGFQRGWKLQDARQ